MANHFFLRKLACDELQDTLFFATGEIPVKHFDNDFLELKTTLFDVKIFNQKRITINGINHKNVSSVKLFIQTNI